MEKFDLPKSEKKMFKRICSWCGANMGFKEGAEGDGEVTHGICEKCAKEMEAELESMKK
jgi:hypothetical protein